MTDESAKPVDAFNFARNVIQILIFVCNDVVVIAISVSTTPLFLNKKSSLA